MRIALLRTRTLNAGINIMTQLDKFRCAALFFAALAAISGLSAQTPTKPPPRMVGFPAGYKPMGSERAKDNQMDAISVREDVWEYLCVCAAHYYETNIIEHLKFTQTFRDRVNAQRESAKRARDLGQSEDADRYDASALELEQQANIIDAQFLAKPNSKALDASDASAKTLPTGLLYGALAYMDAQQMDTIQEQIRSTKQNVLDLLVGRFVKTLPNSQAPEIWKLNPSRQSEAEAMVRQLGMALDLLKSGNKQGAQVVMDRAWESILRTAMGPAPGALPSNAVVPQGPEQVAQFQAESESLGKRIQAQQLSDSPLDMQRLTMHKAWLDGVLWIAKNHPRQAEQLAAQLKHPQLDPTTRMRTQSNLDEWNMALKGNRSAIKKVLEPLGYGSNLPLFAFFADVQSGVALHRVKDTLNNARRTLHGMQKNAKTQGHKEAHQPALEAIDSIIRMMRDNQLAEAQAALDAQWDWVLEKQPSPQGPTGDKKESASTKAVMEITQEWVDMYKDGRVSNSILETRRFEAFRDFVWCSTMDNNPKPAKVAVDTIRSIAFQHCPNSPFLAFLMDAGIPEFQERMAICIQAIRKQGESLQDRPQAQSLAPYVDCMAESLALAKAGNPKGAQELLDKQWKAVLEVTKIVYMPTKEEDRRISIKNPAWLDRNYQKGLQGRLQQVLESKGPAWEAAKIGIKLSYISRLERDTRSKANQMKSIDNEIQRLIEKKKAGFDVDDQLTAANKNREELARGTPIRELMPLNCASGAGRLKNSDTRLTDEKAQMIAPKWLFYPVRNPELASSIQQQIEAAGANPPADIRPTLDRHRKLLSLLQQGDLTAAQASLDQLIDEVLAVER